GHNGHGKVAYGTEAGLFALAGIPTVVIGPGSIDQAHKADEYIAVSQLETCSAFLDRLIAYSRAEFRVVSALTEQHDQPGPPHSNTSSARACDGTQSKGLPHSALR